jgi:hypothetical protein
MSGFFENLLKDTAKGFFGNEYLRDYTHASKTFRTNSYGYAPKFKFLFHVYFDINKDLISATQSWNEDSNFGLAVKSVELPKYQFDVATLNQYNRKRLVQTKIKYQPINIKFHDDNNNIIRNMWNVYYTYYYKDATQDILKTNANKRNIYQPSIMGDEDWGYIGEGTDGPTPSNSSLGMSKPAFFKSIDVFGFNQHNFVQYKLVNPIISSFEHDTYTYSESGVMENSMSIDYETVKYYEGALDGRTPGELVKEFGSEKHYDTRLSPIARPGSNASILGQGGLVDAVGGIINDLTMKIIRPKYNNDKDFKSFIDSLLNNKFKKHKNFLLKNYDRESKELFMKIIGFLDSDILLTMKDRILAPKYKTYNEKNLRILLKKIGYKKIYRIKKKVSFFNIRRLLTPFYHHYDNEISRALYGDGIIHLVVEK